jgi:L-methionine (R)-S-oxide reductase
LTPNIIKRFFIMRTEYSALLQEIESIISSGAELHKILSETCSTLKNKIFHYDWVGFYILNDQKSHLILGPFCGKPTEHTIIPVGKGVCGQVAENNKLKIVQDVSQERNYISCSVDVQSEIVVPILKNDEFVAEIDIDSHATAPFTSDDQDFLSLVCQKLSVLFLILSIDRTSNSSFFIARFARYVKIGAITRINAKTLRV